MIVKDAKEMAGQYYDENRSELFRRAGVDQDTFVNTQWPRFVAAVRTLYADMLTRDWVKQDDKDLMYEALLDDAKHNRSPLAKAPLQIAPNTQAFKGDRFENRRNVEKFGGLNKADLLKAYLRSTSSMFST